MSIRTDTPRNAKPWQGVSTKLTRKAGVWLIVAQTIMRDTIVMRDSIRMTDNG